MLNSEIFKALFADEDIYFIENKAFDIVPAEDRNIVLEAPSSIEKPIESSIIVEAKSVLNSSTTTFPLLIVTESISEAQKVFLEKILNAVDLSLDNICIYNKAANPNTNFKAFSEKKTYHKIISFGVPFSKLNLSIMLVPYENTILDNVVFY